MISWIQNAFDGDIQTFCRVCGERNPIRTFRPEQLRQGKAGVNTILDAFIAPSWMLRPGFPMLQRAEVTAFTTQSGLRWVVAALSKYIIFYTSHHTDVDTLKMKAVAFHQGTQRILTIHRCAPCQSAVSGNASGHRNDPSVCVFRLANSFHGHGIGCGEKGDHQLFCFLNHRITFFWPAAAGSLRFPVYPHPLIHRGR